MINRDDTAAHIAAVILQCSELGEMAQRIVLQGDRSPELGVLHKGGLTAVINDALLSLETSKPAKDYVDVVFDGPPTKDSGRFVEVENSHGGSVAFGEWVRRPDGYWVLRIPKTNK